MKRQILGLSSDLRFFLYQVPVSMRGGIEKLKGIVINDLSMDPHNGDVYIFISNNHKTIKILHYEDNVFTLYKEYRIFNPIQNVLKSLFLWASCTEMVHEA